MSIELDGSSQHVDIALSTAFPTTGSYAVAMWLKNDNDPVGSTEYCFTARDDPGHSASEAIGGNFRTHGTVCLSPHILFVVLL